MGTEMRTSSSATGTARMCRGMKATHLEDLHQAFVHEQHAVELPRGIMSRARASLERMLEYV